MKMDVAYKKVCEIPLDVVDNIYNNIAEEDWTKWDYRKNAGGMEDCNSIPIHHTPLCATGLCNMEAIKSIRKEPAYDVYFPLIEPVLEKLKEYYNFNQYAAFLARLAPGGTIEFHCDHGDFLSKCHRIHVPIKTNPKIYYCIDQECYYWEKGNIYEFDNMRRHGVYNKSDDYRIHLVINLYNIAN